MNATKSPTVGQEVAIAHTGPYSNRFYFGYFVTKVTPSGQITVSRAEQLDKFARRFDANGREIGSNVSKYNRDTLHLNVEELRERTAKEVRADKAASALNAVRLEGRAEGSYGKEALEARVAKLEELLAEARSLVEAI